MGAMAPVGVTVVGAVQTALCAVPLSAEPEDGLTVADAEDVAVANRRSVVRWALMTRIVGRCPSGPAPASVALTVLTMLP